MFLHCRIIINKQNKIQVKCRVNVIMVVHKISQLISNLKYKNTQIKMKF